MAINNESNCYDIDSLYCCFTSRSSGEISKTLNTVEGTNNIQKVIRNNEFKEALSINLNL